MFRRKFISLGSSLLMILALTLPVASFNVPSALAATSVATITPTSGGTGGSTAVTITGLDFQGTCTPAVASTFTTVQFGVGFSVPGTVLNNTTLTATSPTHPAGPATITVTQTGNTCGVLAVVTPAGPTFTYIAPLATGIAPTSGSTLGGTPVTVTGSNLEGTTSVCIDSVAPSCLTGLTVTSSTITGTTAAHAVGTFAVCIINPNNPAPGVCGPAVFSFAVVAATSTATATLGTPGTITPTVILSPTGLPGCSTVTGTVTGWTTAAGTTGVIPGAIVVFVNSSTGARFGTHANALGVYSICIPAGTYQETSVDGPTLDIVGCPAIQTSCGNAVFTQLLVVSTAMTSNISLPVKSVPTFSPALTGAEVVVIGEIRDARTGVPAVGVTVTVVQGATTAIAVTDATGRYVVRNAALIAGLATVSVTSPTGSCPVFGDVADECTDGMTLALGINDPSFIVIGVAAVPTTTIGSLGTGVLQGIIPLIFRDTDTSRTGGIDIETDTIRVLNGGSQRTIACLDFYGSDNSGRRTTSQRQCLDLNPSATGVFSGDIVPSGLMGFAEVYSIDLDGPVSGCPGTAFVGTPTATITTGGIVPTGCIYGVSDIHTTVTQRVVDADGALGGANGLTCEDVLGSVAACGSNAIATTTLNQNQVLPVVLKNSGGTVDKWDTVVNACQASGVPGTQPIVFEFWSVNSPGSPGFAAPFFYNRTADPGGCVTFNLRDLDFLDNGPYALSVTSTGLQGVAPSSAGVLAFPNTFTLGAVMFSRTGKAATANNGYSPATGGATTSSCGSGGGAVQGLTGVCSSKLYGPLIFSDYTVGGGTWWSGIAFSNFPSTGTSGSTAITVTIIDEAGVTRGVINDRPGADSTSVFWLGAQPGTENRGVWNRGRLIVPLDRNFRGSFIADVTDATGTLNSGTRRPFALVHHTNYARKAFISYNAIREESLNPTQFGLPAQAADTRPCSMFINTQLNVGAVVNAPAPLGSTCLWVPEVWGSVPQLTARSNATGVRFFNPGASVVTVDVEYFDGAGIEWTDSRTSFSIGPFSTATIFTGTDFRLPPNFSGSIYIAAACSAGAGTSICAAPIAAISNTIDYSVTTHDAARAMNVPSQTGFTQ